MRCDLHVHSTHSGRVDQPLLRNLGRDSYSEPLDVYRTALRRGMDLVTLTDHNSIDGVLKIVGLPNVFMSEEVTWEIPGGRKIHLGVLDINERQHERIQRLRRDGEALFAYLAEQNLPFCVNHPFSPMTGRREIADLRMAFERAPAVEVLNGMMPHVSNAHALSAAREAGRASFGGSDAHSMASVARACTEVPGARTLEDFVAGLRRGTTRVSGRSGSYSRLVADITSVFSKGYVENFWLAGKSIPDLLRFVGTVALTPVIPILPAIGFLCHARERIMAEVYHRRYTASLAESRRLEAPELA